MSSFFESLKLLAFGLSLKLSWVEPALNLQGPFVLQRARNQRIGTLSEFSYSPQSPSGSLLQLFLIRVIKDDLCKHNRDK